MVFIFKVAYIILLVFKIETDYFLIKWIWKHPQKCIAIDYQIVFLKLKLFEKNKII